MNNPTPAKFKIAKKTMPTIKGAIIKKNENHQNFCNTSVAFLIRSCELSLFANVIAQYNYSCMVRIMQILIYKNIKNILTNLQGVLIRFYQNVRDSLKILVVKFY